MTKPLPRILVLGSQGAFSQVFKQLEAADRYRFDYAHDSETVRAYLERRRPSVVLLLVPAEPESAENALAFLEALKEHAAAVVVSPGEDMRLYLTAMERGAFDYFTCHTPLREITRVLDNAIRWRPRQAA